MEIITNLKMNVSVVIHVLNEKESLPELVRELEHSLSTYSVWETREDAFCGNFHQREIGRAHV